MWLSRLWKGKFAVNLRELWLLCVSVCYGAFYLYLKCMVRWSAQTLLLFSPKLVSYSFWSSHFAHGCKLKNLRGEHCSVVTLPWPLTTMTFFISCSISFPSIITITTRSTFLFLAFLFYPIYIYHQYIFWISRNI